jgi:hydroxyethylthiazole kinase-like uncharacterized protein yjeF
MDPLPVEVFSAASVRAMDRRAIEEAGIPGFELMQRAAVAAFAAIREHWPAAKRVTVLCGPGNNAGDGYLVARRARAAGLDVHVVAMSDPERLRGDAARAHADFSAQGGRTRPPGDGMPGSCDLVVDAMLGTGVDRPLEEPYVTAIQQVNRLAVPVLALDIPSGLDADTGQPHGCAVSATRTLAFLALKSGYYLGRAPDFLGALDFAGLGLPQDVLAGESPVMRRIDGKAACRALPPRRRAAHKGDHGRLLIVGGHAMPGAARLAGESALRAGAGLVTVATSPASAAAVLAGRPELIVKDGMPTDLSIVDAIAVGPGLGTGAEAQRLLDAVVASGARLVLDADALTLLAERPRKPQDWILTPHPGEAGRLLGTNAEVVQRDRLGSIKAIVERYGGTCVLKGANTLVCGASHGPWVCDRGNPGMATAGSGDVLTGVITALLAMTLDDLLAATAGVFLHAEAGDRAGRAGMRGMVASDIVAELRGVVNASWS